jgi:hypothetical protein
MPILDNNIKSDYRILISRSQTRPKAELYHFKSKFIPTLATRSHSYTDKTHTSQHFQISSIYRTLKARIKK